jgi:hypothetical protein
VGIKWRQPWDRRRWMGRGGSGRKHQIDGRRRRYPSTTAEAFHEQAEEEDKNDQSLMPTLINDIYFGSFFIELWMTFKTIRREYNKSTCIAAVSYIYIQLVRRDSH